MRRVFAQRNPLGSIFCLALLLALTGCPRDSADVPEAPPRAEEPTAGVGELDQQPPPTGATPEQDMAAVREHELRVADVQRYGRAAEAVHQAVTQDPELRRVEAELQQRFERAETVSEVEQILADYPRLRQAIEEAGISTEDYILTGAALFGAYNYILMREQGIPDPFRPDYVTNAHVRFIEENRAEVDAVVRRLMEAYGAETDY